MDAFLTAAEYAAMLYQPIPADDFARYALRASEAVNDATHGRAEFVDDERIMARVKQATGAMIEYYFYNGLDAATGEADVNSYQIGKTMVTTRASNGASNSGIRGGLCGAARRALQPTGLLYSGAEMVQWKSSHEL